MKRTLLCLALVSSTASCFAATSPKQTLQQSLDFSRYFPLAGITEYTLAVNVFGSPFIDKELTTAEKFLGETLFRKLRETGIAITRQIEVSRGKQAHIGCYVGFLERWDPGPSLTIRGYTRTITVEVTAPMTNPRSGVTKETIIWRDERQDAVGDNKVLPTIEAELLLQKLAIDALRANSKAN
jgi:hypothetical protein